MRLILLFLFIPTNILADEVKNAECQVACKKSSYEYGVYKSNYCLCINKKLYEDITGKDVKVTIHPNDIPVSLTVEDNNY